MENMYEELTYFEAITNKEILDEKSINKYLKEFQKKSGNLQKNLRDIIMSKYQLVYQSVEWCGRGANRTLKIGKKYPIAQVSVHKNTGYSSVLNASLMILLINDRFNENNNISETLMTKPKWLREAGIIDNDFSFINRDDVKTILEIALLRYAGKENSDIISFAIWFYEKNIRMFINKEFDKTENFLKKNYNINMISEDRWNLSDEHVFNLYADKLVQVINERQKHLVNKNIESEMYSAWVSYNSGNKKTIPADLKSLILDYPVSQLKRNINKSIYINELGLGAAKRILFDIEDKLTIGEYEVIEEMKNTTAVNKRFYKLTKRIKPSEAEIDAVEIPLSEFRSNNNFNIQKLIYDPSSEESKSYRYLEKSILNKLGYEMKYALKLFEEASIKEAIVNTPYIIVKSINDDLLTVPISLFNKGKVTNGSKDKFAEEILKNILTETSQKLQKSYMLEYIKKQSMKNRGWVNLKTQYLIDDTINDLLYVLLLAIHEFFNNPKYIPDYTITDHNLMRREADKTTLFNNETFKKIINTALKTDTIKDRINNLEDRIKELSKEEILQLNSLKNQRLESDRAYNILTNIKTKLIKV